MPRYKNFKASESNSQPITPAEPVSKSLITLLPPNPKRWKQIDHSKYLGLGFDQWVIQIDAIIKSLIATGNHSITTILNYSALGLRYFLKFLTMIGKSHAPRGPDELTKDHIELYIAWLKENYPNGSSAKNCYSSFKSVLRSLIDYGFIKKDMNDLLPLNPFPQNSLRTRSAESLSMGEMQRLITALKADLISIHKGNFKGNDGEAMTVLLLITCTRTGINSTPVFEMSRNAMAPHPILPSMKLIYTTKRRGKGAQIKSIRQTNLIDEYSAIPLDGAAVLEKAIAISAALVPIAPIEIKQYIWLYRSSQRGWNNNIACLNDTSVCMYTKNICRRHGLLSDSGETLRVTLGRLRATMENRLFRLSGGDITEVSSVMGHSPRVADNHYLKINDDVFLEGAKFVGEAFPQKLRGIHIEPTPTGGCKDTLYGKLAPRDGVSHCSDFSHCLECPSYAIVGSPEDLYRLFSYQQFLKLEIAYYPDNEWSNWRTRQLEHISLIDEFTLSNFDSSVVAGARLKAEQNAHPFWAKKIALLEKRNGDHP